MTSQREAGSRSRDGMPLIPIGSNTLTSPMARRRSSVARSRSVFTDETTAGPSHAFDAVDQSRRLAGLARAEEQHGTSHASSAAERLALGHQHSSAPSAEHEPAGLGLSAEERREIPRLSPTVAAYRRRPSTAVDRLVSALPVLQPQDERSERSGEDHERRCSQ